MKPIKYGNWTITYWCKPIPDRNHDYEGTHDDYDGPEDSRAFTGPSIKDIKQQIDDYEAEN